MGINVIVPCLGALVLAFASWIYLGYATVPPEERAGSFRSTLFANKKALVWAVVTAAAICAAEIAIGSIYPGNGLLLNLRLAVLLAVLFTAAYTDWRGHIIPNKLILTALVLRVVIWAAEFFTSPDTFFSILKNDLVACLIPLGFFVVGVLLMKNGIGMGDIKLMLVMCLYQGFSGVVSSLFFSLIGAFFVALFLLISKKRTKKDAIAFAPAILIGTFISVVLAGM